MSPLISLPGEPLPLLADLSYGDLLLLYNNHQRKLQEIEEEVASRFIAKCAAIKQAADIEAPF